MLKGEGSGESSAVSDVQQDTRFVKLVVLSRGRGTRVRETHKIERERERERERFPLKDLRALIDQCQITRESTMGLMHGWGCMEAICPAM